MSWAELHLATNRGDLSCLGCRSRDVVLLNIFIVDVVDVSWVAGSNASGISRISIFVFRVVSGMLYFISYGDCFAVALI